MNLADYLMREALSDGADFFDIILACLMFSGSLVYIP